MEESLKWTERIDLSEVRDPLQLAVFRFPDQKFLPGITTQTLRIRYFTYMTWASNQIKERKVEPRKILDLEKILALVSAYHHENNDAPIGIRNIGDSNSGAREFLSKNSQIDLDKFTSFGKRNKKGYGEAFHGGPLQTLGIKWWENDEHKQYVISPAGKNISKIFSEYMEKIEDKVWSKTLKKSDLQNMTNLCCCSIPIEEQDFWKKVFFGLTKLRKDDTLEIDYEKHLEIINADKLQFGKNYVREFDFEAELDEEDSEFFDTEFEADEKKGSLEKEMRKATLFLLLEIIKNSKPDSSGYKLYQTIRDSFYYSEFQVKGNISQIDFNQQLESYRKYWEVYAHNQYYVTIFEKTLSVILDISKRNPFGIEIDKLIKKIDSKEFLDSINKNLGFQISDSDSVQTVYENLVSSYGDEKTKLSSTINEHNILEKILKTKTTDQTETLGLVFVLFLLCKYRYSSFDENALRMNNAIEHEKWNNVKPETKYDEFGKIQVTKFPEELLRFVIKRYRRVSARKFFSNGTKAWLFTVHNDILYFNDQEKKKFKVKLYRDTKWNNVLEIMSDLGLVKKNNKNWEITREGEDWLNKIQ